MFAIRTLLLAAPIVCAACGGATVERNTPDGGHGASTPASGGSSSQPGAGGRAPSGQGGQSGSNIDGGSCTGGPKRQIHYVARDPGACATIRYTCPANTDYYSDEFCGCGCIQDPDCPVFVDCEPTTPPSPIDPLCTDGARCPYTQRAL